MATDYEKKYKEALERAKRLTSDMTTLQKIREFIFPELAESEDERIRKHLIEIVETYWGKTNEPGKAADLAWLEKQKDEEGFDAIPVDSTLEYKLGFKAGKDSVQKEITLQDNLDEAAIEYASKWHKNPDGSEWTPIFAEGAVRDFKAGAEWMAKQMNHDN